MQFVHALCLPLERGDSEDSARVDGYDWVGRLVYWLFAQKIQRRDNHVCSHCVDLFASRLKVWNDGIEVLVGYGGLRAGRGGSGWGRRGKAQ